MLVRNAKTQPLRLAPWGIFPTQGVRFSLCLGSVAIAASLAHLVYANMKTFCDPLPRLRFSPFPQSGAANILQDRRKSVSLLTMVGIDPLGHPVPVWYPGKEDRSEAQECRGLSDEQYLNERALTTGMLI